MTETSAVLVRTAAELDASGGGKGPRSVVMTMGALHEGHASLIRAARAAAGPDGQVVVTVFVNPLQFGEAADLDRYPVPSTPISPSPARPVPTWSSPRPSTRSTPAVSRRSGSLRARWASGWKGRFVPAISTGC